MRGTKLGAVTLLAGAAMLGGGTTATAAPQPADAATSGLAGIAAPVVGEPVAGAVGAVGEPLVPCPAPWAGPGVNISEQYLTCVSGALTD
ncbi:hypothetical protein OG495_03220 [Streptomyces longwoodensis]|uniref:hypothetical protein n=1 Tax=Streptomyces longwoodensis TaxID=68231 RepID=UPI00386F5D89